MRTTSLVLFTCIVILMLNSCSKKNNSGEEVKTSSTLKLYYEFHDFESLGGSYVDSTKGASGKNCGKVNDKIEFGFAFEKQIGSLPSFKNIQEVSVGFNCLMDKKMADDVFVISIEDTVTKKSIYWEAQSINPEKTGSWSPAGFTFKVKEEYLNPAYILKLYPWNKGKNTYFYDDLSISINATTIDGIDTIR